MIVCYLVEIEGFPSLILFGHLKDVEADLKKIRQQIGLHPIQQAVVNHLLTHDLSKVPESPYFGEGKLQIKGHGTVNIKVSRRGEHDGYVFVG